MLVFSMLMDAGKELQETESIQKQIETDFFEHE